MGYIKMSLLIRSRALCDPSHVNIRKIRTTRSLTHVTPGLCFFASDALFVTIVSEMLLRVPIGTCSSTHCLPALVYGVRARCFGLSLDRRTIDCLANLLVVDYMYSFGGSRGFPTVDCFYTLCRTIVFASAYPVCGYHTYQIYSQ